MAPGFPRLFAATAFSGARRNQRLVGRILVVEAAVAAVYDHALMIHSVRHAPEFATGVGGVPSVRIVAWHESPPRRLRERRARQRRAGDGGQSKDADVRTKRSFHRSLREVRPQSKRAVSPKLSGQRTAKSRRALPRFRRIIDQRGAGPSVRRILIMGAPVGAIFDHALMIQSVWRPAKLAARVRRVPPVRIAAR